MAIAKKVKELIEKEKCAIDKAKKNNNVIKYETLKNGYITKEQAIAIAGCDRNLKDSIFKEWKSQKMYLGWISFEKFDVALVQFGCDFAWHIKVKSGSYGGNETKKIFGIPYKDILFDGEFDEDSNISCIVMCDSGQYYYSKDIDMSQMLAPDLDEYRKYIKQNSIYHS